MIIENRNNIPSSIELEQLTKLYRAMGDLTRMKILWFLMEGELCVSELAYKMDLMNQPFHIN